MPPPLYKYFIAPPLPKNSAAFLEEYFAAVSLNRTSRGFALESLAVTQLPEGLLAADFDDQNIKDLDELERLCQYTLQMAGLADRRRWSVALPEGAARTFIITIESKPASRAELEEIISWKIERAVAAPTSELRISRQPLSGDDGQQRYLVTIARQVVLQEYESLFKRLGWRAGLILPRHLGEAQWLMLDQSPEDKMLIASHRCGFSAVILKGREPALVRAETCEPESLLDELYRTAVYYQDRMPGARIGTLLVTGNINRLEAQRAIGDAFGERPALFDPALFGVKLNEQIEFDQIAAASGLAIMRWL
jgi:hypothetical protein